MTSNIFINFTNHPSEKWSKEQWDASLKYGSILDLPFPVVSPLASKEEVEQMAEGYVDQIMKHSPSAVLCQGEFSLSYSVITKLKAHGILVLAACSERNVQKDPDDPNKKTVTFKFVQFREY